MGKQFEAENEGFRQSIADKTEGTDKANIFFSI